MVEWLKEKEDVVLCNDIPINKYKWQRCGFYRIITGTGDQQHGTS